ncbi:MAG: TenA family transcriptional regulator [Bacteroidota bacterium]
MKRTKQISIDDAFTGKYALSKTSPPADSLFWKLWNNNKDIGVKALNTKYIQGMNTGTLDPNVYARYNISDAYYCYRGPEDYEAAVKRAKNPILKAFLEMKRDGYIKYDAELPGLWRVKSGNGIIPSEVCKEYADYETAVATGTLPLLKDLPDPIYTLIVMLPCEYLWPWLAQQMSPTKGNLYNFWITGNNDPSGAYKIGNFINEYEKEHPIDHTVANEIYRNAMNYEYLNFETAV